MGLTQVNSGGIEDGSIVNADIKSDSAIALSKLASTPAVLTGSTNNTITTVTAANTIQGEANLTFDGNNLDVSGGCITTFGGNSTNESACIKVGYEGSSKGQIRVYGADASTTGSLEFKVCEGDGTDDHTMLFDGSGNLGINTASPEDLLHLKSGKLRIENAIVSNNDSTISYDNSDFLIDVDPNNVRGSSQFKVNIDTVAALTVDDSRNVRVEDGDLIIETAGHGINFHPHSGTANLLSDYEEGTFTPTLLGGGSEGSIAYSNRQGTYTKIGRQVTVNLGIELSSRGGSSNDQIDIGGLPFTVGDLLSMTSHEASGSCQYWQNFAQDMVNVGVTADDGQNKLFVVGTLSNGDTGNTHIHRTQIADNWSFRASITYFTA